MLPYMDDFYSSFDIFEHIDDDFFDDEQSDEKLFPHSIEENEF